MPSAGEYANMVRVLVTNGCPGSLEELQNAANILVTNGVCNKQALALVAQDDVIGFGTLSRPIQVFVSEFIARETVAFVSDPGGSVALPDCKQMPECETASVLHVIKLLEAMRLKSTQAPSAGPINTITVLEQCVGTVLARKQWASEARLEALCASCARSIPSVFAGLKCWHAFATKILKVPAGMELPPSADGLIVWSRCFRSHGTFCNYTSYLKFACVVANVSLDAFHHAALGRAKRGVAAMQGPPKTKKYIRQDILAGIVKLAEREGRRREALLYIISYAFLLRVPSEGLPIVVGEPESGLTDLGATAHSRLSLTNGRLVLQLAIRKNKRHGSVLSRDCWCKTCSVTCPVHKAKFFLEDKMWQGQALFKDFTPSGVVKTLRARLRALGVSEPQYYGTHDFRRGHAVDMQFNGKCLAEILRAGAHIISKPLASASHAIAQGNGRARLSCGI